MEAAKAAVSKLTGHKGHYTEVDEYVNPAVVSETIRPQRHEEIVEAVDREVHQHHYHTTVQPISHTEVLPERHTHNQLAVENREFQHGNHDATKQKVTAELSQFQNTSKTVETRHTQVAAPTVTGEHVHHHVHETVQPIINKETIQPEVVHTVVPIHETHHVDAKYHGMSALPMKTLSEFKSAGGILTGNKTHTHEEYDGAPRAYNEKLSTTIERVLPGHHSSSTTGTHGTHGTGHHTSDSGVGFGSDHRSSGTGLTGTSSHSGTHTKPSASDRLNPRVDADRDGKAGFMD